MIRVIPGIKASVEQLWTLSAVGAHDGMMVRSRLLRIIREGCSCQHGCKMKDRGDVKEVYGTYRSGTCS